MAYTYEELKEKTVAQLREIASGLEDEAVRGYKTMRKADLLQAVCRALGVDTHEHHVVVGLDKTEIKARIRALKEKRDAALAARDQAELKRIRRNIRRLKRKIRRATV